ncbi:MAG: hypothetical protein PF693_09810 [Spirochaetia bacterium]|jgi:hypothetical protein|nr:hypothetical protein [Spirochaetia bacterium]
MGINDILILKFSIYCKKIEKFMENNNTAAIKLLREGSKRYPAGSEASEEFSEEPQDAWASSNEVATSPTAKPAHPENSITSNTARSRSLT